jgi:hypothetical protein
VGAGQVGGRVVPLLVEDVAHTATCFGFIIDLSTNQQSSAVTEQKVWKCQFGLLGFVLGFFSLLFFWFGLGVGGWRAGSMKSNQC